MNPGTSSSGAQRGRIIFWGFLASMPFGGMTWQVLHYLLGAKRLGFDVWFVDDYSWQFMSPDSWGHATSVEKNAAFVRKHMAAIGLSENWVLEPPGLPDTAAGCSTRLAELYGSADLVVNLCGAVLPGASHENGPPILLLQTDPFKEQIGDASGNEAIVAHLARHQYLYTYGLNIDRPSCPVRSGRFEWRTTVPPVCMDLWDPLPLAVPHRFTTVANWRNSESKNLSWKGDVYRWQKNLEYEPIIDLPRQVSASLEISLSGVNSSDQEMLSRHGWMLSDARQLSDPQRYHDYVCGSLGEFSVVKDSVKRLHSGWFSDRAVCYLAAGRPVITQDTGISEHLTPGEGLVLYSSRLEAMEAIEAVTNNYDHHSRAARKIAEEFFDSERVLTRMFTEIGLL